MNCGVCGGSSAEEILLTEPERAEIARTHGHAAPTSIWVCPPCQRLLKGASAIDVLVGMYRQKLQLLGVRDLDARVDQFRQQLTRKSGVN